MSKFTTTLNSELLMDFAKCVEKSSNKPDYIHFVIDDQGLCLFSETYDSSVSLSIPNIIGDILNVAVNAKEFISTVNKFNEDDLTISFRKKKVELSLGNAKASLCTVFSDKERPTSQVDGVPVTREGIFWLIEYLTKCADSVSTVLKDDARFQDILLCSGDFTYVTRFTETAVRICASENIGFRGRVVVPSRSTKMIKHFGPKISKCYIGSNAITFLVSCYDIPAILRTSFSLMADNYPQDCLSFLKLNKSLPITSVENSYQFYRDHLLQALDLVSSSIGDESQVKFEIIGHNGENASVWKLSSSSFKGSSCEEIVASIGPCEVYTEPFFLHGKRTMKALESCGEIVTLRNHSQSTFALIGHINDLTLLSKGSG